MFKEGQLLVTFYEHTNLQAKNESHAKLGGKKIDEIPQLHLEVIEVPIGEESKYKVLYEQHPDVRFVDYNLIGKLHYKQCKCTKCKQKTCGCIPNDPYYLEKIETSAGLQNQWGLQRINPELAFCEVKGRGPVIKIGILDSGIDPNHPDLKDKIIDPINFTSDNPEDYIDTDGHGTRVSGIAAAITNNQTGIASASYNTAYIVPIKVVTAGIPNQDILVLNIIKGIVYAIEKQVDVINMSLGFFQYAQALQIVLEMAWNQGIISVASAGNEGNEQPSYPAAYNFVLGVSATDKTNMFASFSNWGIYVGITAPGTDILSTFPTYLTPEGKPNYVVSDGTSFSAPFVSGVAAMLRAIKPSASNQEIIQAIQRSASSLNPKNKKWDPFYGYGLLNLSAAVQEIKCPQIPYGNYCKILGSFYGQVVDSEGNPLGGAVVSAIRDEEVVRDYQTKCTTYDINEDCTQSDGMFRLFDLPGGKYTISGWLNSNTGRRLRGRLIEQVVLGTDVYVKLVLEDTPIDVTSVF